MIVMQPPAKGYSIDLTMCRDLVQIALSGDIDLATAASLRTLFDSLQLIHSDICVHLAAVTFIDSAGLEPLIDATRDRRHPLSPKLRIGSYSTPVLRLLKALGMDTSPVLDVARWDQLADSPLLATGCLLANMSR